MLDLAAWGSFRGLGSGANASPATATTLRSGSLSDSTVTAEDYIIRMAEQYFTGQAVVLGHLNHLPVTRHPQRCLPSDPLGPAPACIPRRGDRDRQWCGSAVGALANGNCSGATVGGGSGMRGTPGVLI